MELQPYIGQEQALQTYQAPQITAEEAEKRQKDAEELEEKLKFIVNDVPDREYHVTGSNAGASSAEFHTYRNSRRREQERLTKIEEEYDKRRTEASLAEKRTRLQAEDEAQTAKRRAKRMKKKEKKTTSRTSNDVDGLLTESSGLLKIQHTAAGNVDRKQHIEQAGLD